MRLALGLCCLLSVIVNTFGANILAIVPTPSFSHQIAFAELWKKLALRGHNVTLVTTDPMNDSSLKNLKEIDMKRSYDVWDNKYKFADVAQEGLDVWYVWEFFLYLLTDVSEDQLNQPELQDLIVNRKKHSFDVVFVEFFYPEFLAFGKLYNCPTILIGTIGTTVQSYQYLGNPAHPVLYPDLNLPFDGTKNFRERLVSTLFHWHQIYYDYFKFVPRKQKVVDTYFKNVSSAKIENLLSDVDMMFVNESPILKGIRALGPNTITVGGGNHLKPLKPLPSDLKEYLDNSKRGFIYFSFGGNVKSQDLKGETLKNILEALSEVPYDVLWKFEADNLPGKPKNVKLIKWAPQQDVLRHPNIKLFISQGGILSIEESLFSNVPMIVLPFYGDQLKNARIVENRGFGKFVNHKPVLLKDDFKQAILEVAQNPKYKETVTTLAKIIQDEPMSGLEKSVWWTEYVIKHKGAKYLRNPAADMPLYQYYLIDVISFFVATSIIVTYLLIKSYKILSGTISNKFYKQKIL